VFAAALEVAEAPWATGHRLVRIGLKAREVTAAERGAANLVFLVDVSGSMSAPERLPLVRESLRLLVNRLRPDDRVAIVTYAGASGLALASTPVGQTREVVAAIEAMTPGGSTNGGMGIHLAYDIAKANFVTGGVNRVILCTDGDFNVGVTGEGELVRLVQEKAKSGVFLTVLGFGMGNLKDGMLEAIADKGNGSYGYIDSRREAEKLLGVQVNGTLTTVAKDVKLQVEFNPARVASYRLIGYENRLLANPDFNNDKVDAGEIGAGHTMTALYEIVPAGTEALALGAGLDELKYTRKPVTVPLAAASTELLTVKVRYKEPAGDVSRKLEFALTDAGARFADASGDFKFASAVAAFGMVLRDSPHKGTATLADVATWAEAGAADDAGGWRGEFIELAKIADGQR
jgi:Ca-activated chloride channel family protein